MVKIHLNVVWAAIGRERRRCGVEGRGGEWRTMHSFVHGSWMPEQALKEENDRLKAEILKLKAEAARSKEENERETQRLKAEVARTEEGKSREIQRLNDERLRETVSSTVSIQCVHPARHGDPHSFDCAACVCVAGQIGHCFDNRCIVAASLDISAVCVSVCEPRQGLAEQDFRVRPPPEIETTLPSFP